MKSSLNNFSHRSECSLLFCLLCVNNWTLVRNLQGRRMDGSIFLIVMTLDDRQKKNNKKIAGSSRQNCHNAVNFHHWIKYVSFIIFWLTGNKYFRLVACRTNNPLYCRSHNYLQQGYY